MIKPETIAEILSLYRKHGWTLRRVLLADELRAHLTDALPDLFGGAEIKSARVDGLWFARPARNGGETWELRRLSDSPFALVEVFEKDVDPEIREEVLRGTENRLRDIKS
ncbi:MAG TPA: hypothetical protein VF692_04340 [Pyrinomonadaceae bacterium]